MGIHSRCHCIRPQVCLKAGREQSQTGLQATGMGLHWCCLPLSFLDECGYQVRCGSGERTAKRLFYETLAFVF